MLKKKQEQDWLLPMFRAAGIAPDADLGEIQKKMDALANRAAPLTRRWWKWIIFIQALAVLIPLAWLRHPIYLPISWIGVAGLLTVGVFVSVNWWLRWRGMQKRWARSRLVAEVSRSLLSTSHCPRPTTLSIFEIIPTLEPLRVIAGKSPRPEASPDWKQDYLKNRIEEPGLDHYRSKQREAERQRRQLSRLGHVDVGSRAGFCFCRARHHAFSSGRKLEKNFRGLSLGNRAGSDGGNRAADIAFGSTTPQRSGTQPAHRPLLPTTTDSRADEDATCDGSRRGSSYGCGGRNGAATARRSFGMVFPCRDS